MSKMELHDNRPMSPHLSIYKLIPTMLMSILHRITGVALYVGTILFAWWIFAAAFAPDYFRMVNEIFGSWFGRLVLFGYTWVLMHHMAGGLRHFVWDTGSAMHRETSTKMAWATLAFSVITTLAIWIVGYAVR